MYRVNNKDYDCPVAVTLDIFNDKWKLYIIWHLLDCEKRFKDLCKCIPMIAEKTLINKLKELEDKDIIKREVFAEVPLKVVYSLTPIGKELKNVLASIYHWGIDYIDEHGKIS